MSRPSNETERFLAKRAGIRLCKTCGGYMLHQEYSCDTITRYFCTECGNFEESFHVTREQVLLRLLYAGYPVHQTSKECWCDPELVYADASNEVYAHRRFI